MAENTGKAGEDYVAEWLAGQGYRLIARNYHTRFGEIDMIAEDGKYIVFVEVKTRRGGSMISPLEAVTPQKLQKIIRTAQLYLAQNPSPYQPRFDVAGVLTAGGKPASLTYYENAFGA